MRRSNKWSKFDIAMAGTETLTRTEEDVALMLRVKDGDMEAFEILVDRHKHSVVGTAVRMLGYLSAESLRLTVETGSIGEVRRHGAAFIAEMRGPAHRLDEERGRLFAAACSAALGDARCGVNLADPAWRETSSVAWSDGQALLRAASLGEFDEGLFSGGSLIWLSGANAGLRQDVRDHRIAAFPIRERWADIGRPDDYVRLREDWVGVRSAGR